MPLTAFAGTNQESALASGKWIWRAVDIVDVAGDASGEHVLFELEKNCVVLDYVLKVTEGVAAGTAVPQVKNSGGDVALVGTGHSLVTAGATFVYNRSYSLGTITDQDSTPFVLEVASMTSGGTCSVLVGVCIARIDLDPS